VCGGVWGGVGVWGCGGVRACVRARACGFTCACACACVCACACACVCACACARACACACVRVRLRVCVCVYERNYTGCIKYVLTVLSLHRLCGIHNPASSATPDNFFYLTDSIVIHHLMHLFPP